MKSCKTIAWKKQCTSLIGQFLYWGFTTADSERADNVHTEWATRYSLQTFETTLPRARQAGWVRTHRQRCDARGAGLAASATLANTSGAGAGAAAVGVLLMRVEGPT